MNAANLTCFKASCHGEFAFVDDDEGGARYECRKCGAELRQGALKELADDDGPVGTLARVLANGGG